MLLACARLDSLRRPGVFPPYVVGLVAGVASGAAMLPYTVIKEANPPELSGTATGVVNFLNFTFSALLAPGLRLGAAARQRRRRRRCSSNTTRRRSTPLLSGVALADRAHVLPERDGTGGSLPARVAARGAMDENWNGKVRSAARAMPQPGAGADRGRASRARRPRWPARSRPARRGSSCRFSSARRRRFGRSRRRTASSSGQIRIVDAPHSHAAAAKAVELVRQGEAELLMKGSLHSDELLGAVVAKETGLRTGRRISHVFIMDVPTYHKVLIVTDAAINIAPTLEDKVDICQNAIDLAMSLGVRKPKVAILAAVETVNSKMPATLDAAALCKMADRGQITGGVLDGPLAFDNAISRRRRGSRASNRRSPAIPTSSSCRISRRATCSPSSSRFLANADSAGLVLGARVPIILTSRADSVRSRIASCAVAMLAAHARRQQYQAIR